jgi:hypothetical protein
MRAFCRTKHRNSRLRSTGYHFRSTSSSAYGSGSELHPVKTDSAVRSCVIKSDDLRSMYTSAGDVHLHGDDCGSIQDASCTAITSVAKMGQQRGVPWATKS